MYAFLFLGQSGRQTTTPKEIQPVKVSVHLKPTVPAIIKSTSKTTTSMGGRHQQSMSKTDQAERIIEIRTEPQSLISKKRLRSPSNPSSIAANTTSALKKQISMQNFRDFNGLLNLAHKHSFRSRSTQPARFVAEPDAAMPRSLSVNYLYQKRQGWYLRLLNKFNASVVKRASILSHK